MPNDPPQGQAVFTPHLPVQVYTHQPDGIDMYQVTEEQLTTLGSGSRDLVLEFLWTAIGAAIGSSPSAIAALSKFHNAVDGYVFQTEELIQVCIMFLAIGLGIVSLSVFISRRRRMSSVESQIRAQKKGIQLGAQT